MDDEFPCRDLRPIGRSRLETTLSWRGLGSPTGRPAASTANTAPACESIPSRRREDAHGGRGRAMTRSRVRYRREEAKALRPRNGLWVMNPIQSSVIRSTSILTREPSTSETGCHAIAVKLSLDDSEVVTSTSSLPREE